MWLLSGIKPLYFLFNKLLFTNFNGINETSYSFDMKSSIYYSATLGMAFLSIRFVGLFIDLTHKDLFLIIGLGILLLVTLPLYLTERRRYDKKKQIIFKTFNKGGKIDKNNKKKPLQKSEYPSFRKQKSGLTWTGGSVHGSSAKRGSKRGFLKH